MTIGEQLRARRHEIGISMTQLSIKSGICREQIYCWERGSKRPRLDLVIAWANALGMDLELRERG